MYQVEEGQETHKKHFQGYFALNNRKRKDQLAKAFNKLMFGVEIIPVVNKEAMIEYCQKPETRLVGPYEYPETYKGLDVQVVENNPLPWQKKLFEIINKKPDERSIYWIFDPMGRAGKSTIAKYIIFKKEGHLLSWDEQRDIYYARRVNKNIVLFDFSRAIPFKIDKTGLYSAIENIKNGAIENIKNGAIFAGKYQSTLLINHMLFVSQTFYLKPVYLATIDGKYLEYEKTKT